MGRDKFWIRKSQIGRGTDANADRTRRRLDADWTQIERRLDADWTKTGCGPDEDRTRTGTRRRLNAGRTQAGRRKSIRKSELHGITQAICNIATISRTCIELIKVISSCNCFHPNRKGKKKPTYILLSYI